MNIPTTQTGCERRAGSLCRKSAECHRVTETNADTGSAGFEEAIGPLIPDMRRFANWLCRDRDTAEDLVQNACLRAWKGRNGLIKSGSVRAWLFTIVRREWARECGRISQWPETMDCDRSIYEQRYDPGYSDCCGLWKAMAQLPAKYRDPLVGHVVGGYSERELAGNLRLSENGVATRIHRAKQKLRVALAG